MDLLETVRAIDDRLSHLPEQRDKAIIGALVNIAKADAPDDKGQVIQYDLHTGQPYYVSLDENGRFDSPDHEMRQLKQYEAMAASMSGDLNPLSPERQEREERMRTVSELTAFGAKPPAGVVRARELSAALDNVVSYPPVLDLSTIDPAKLTDTFNAYVDAKLRATVADQERKTLRAEVSKEMVKEIQGSIDHYLKEEVIRQAFTDAAESFSRVYPAVKDCRSLTDAAAIDETGNGVVAWHTANHAVADLDAVIAMLLGVVAPPYQDFRSGLPEKRTAAAKYLSLSAPVPEAGAVILRGALGSHGVRIEDGRLRINEPLKPHEQGNRIWSPWKQYGAQLDSGVSLSLPADEAELKQRAEDYGL